MWFVPLPNGVSMATAGARPCVAVSNTQGCFLSFLPFSELCGGISCARRHSRYAATPGRVGVVSSGFPRHLSIQHIVSPALSRSLPSCRPPALHQTRIPCILFPPSITSCPYFAPSVNLPLDLLPATSDRLSVTQTCRNTPQRFHGKLCMLMEAAKVLPKVKPNNSQGKKQNKHPTPRCWFVIFFLTSSSCVPVLSV